MWTPIRVVIKVVAYAVIAMIVIVGTPVVAALIVYRLSLLGQ